MKVQQTAQTQVTIADDVHITYTTQPVSKPLTTRESIAWLSILAAMFWLATSMSCERQAEPVVGTALTRLDIPAATVEEK